MADDKKTPRFLGHPLLDEKDKHELHLNSALKEFHGGLPRDEAEKAALQEYRNEAHGRAAAHHFQGMKIAHTVGDMDTAQKHHALYSLHVKALGKDPNGPVPEEVRKYHAGANEDKKQKKLYNFRTHEADQYLVKPLGKSTPNPTQLILQAGAALADNIKIEVADYLEGLSDVEKPVEPEPTKEVVAPVETDPVKIAAGNLKKTLEVLSMAKALIAKLEAAGK